MTTTKYISSTTLSATSGNNKSWICTCTTITRILFLFLNLVTIVNSSSETTTTCKDVEWYRYNGVPEQTCEWVSKDPETRCSLIDYNFVETRDKCRKTCDNCRPLQVGGISRPIKRMTGQYCNNSSQCASGVCLQDACYESESCKPVRHSWGKTFDRNTIILVFVGSGFTDAEEWQRHVLTTFNEFNEFEMFGHDNTRFNAFYVDILEEEGFCKLGCKGVDTLLCCDIEKAKSLSKRCFSSQATLQTVVIHNDSRYGGAGYRDNNIATTTIHDSGGRVAVHELGHSLFEFGDEYKNGAFSAENSANCDVSGCPKWSDLSKHLGVDLCQPGACKDGSYYTSELTFMSGLGNPVGDVNLRYTCCTYLALTNGFPSYCQKYEFGEGLVSYCKRDFQDYGGAAAYQLLDPTYHNDVYAQEEEDYSNDGMNHDYLIVARPVILNLNVKDETFTYEDDMNDQITGPTIYRRRQIQGDYPDIISAARRGETTLLKITIKYKSGEKQVLLFRPLKSIHVPPSVSNEYIPLEVVDEPKQEYMMEIVVDGNKGDVDDVEFEEIKIRWWRILIAWLQRLWSAIVRFFINLFT